MTDISRSSLFKLILSEVFSSLPGRRRLTQQEPPEDPFDSFTQNVYTGALNTGKLLKPRERLLGLALWLSWLGFGLYFWWFTEVPSNDYLIGTVVWGLIFLFTIFGIPITRAIFQHRKQK